jgi:hypothetical protein
MLGPLVCSLNYHPSHALREKEQAQAGKLLARVQLQMSEFVVSVGTANLHSVRTL